MRHWITLRLQISCTSPRGPTDRQVEIIKSLHVRLILCLFIERPGPALTLPPFQMLHLRTFDSPLASLPLRVI